MKNRDYKKVRRPCGVCEPALKNTTKPDRFGGPQNSTTLTTDQRSNVWHTRGLPGPSGQRKYDRKGGVRCLTDTRITCGREDSIRR